MVTIQQMTRELARTFFQNYRHDLSLFEDISAYRPYVYSMQLADAAYDRHKNLGREYLAILADGTCVGEAVLKNLDSEKKCCTLGICLQNDSVKNRGYGTAAEVLLLEYAFQQMKLDTVFADALIKNLRSQHVLEKVGFRETHRTDRFVYYRCNRESWNRPDVG